MDSGASDEYVGQEPETMNLMAISKHSSLPNKTGLNIRDLWLVCEIGCRANVIYESGSDFGEFDAGRQERLNAR